jgi:chemotaxis protein histidine kinase CheA
LKELMMTENLIVRADDDATRDDADVGKKLDSLLSGLDSLTKRMDSMESSQSAADSARRADAEAKEYADSVAAYSDRKDEESDEDYKKRADAEEEGQKKGFMAKGDPEPVAADKAKRVRRDAEVACDKKRADAKARKDAEDKEKEEKERADAARADSNAAISPAVQKQLDDLRSKIPAQIADEDRELFARAQARVDDALCLAGDRAPRPLLGETVAAFRQRLVRLIQPHCSDKYKKLDLAKINDPASFDAMEGLVIADAIERLRTPSAGGDGNLRMVERRLDSGHIERTFHGAGPGSWIARFSGNLNAATLNPPAGRR